VSVETDIQFLARMMVATREGHQISSRDARRLNDLAEFGMLQGEPSNAMTTMPEERREGSKPLTEEGGRDLVVG
jgi:hypothetical protein